MDNETGYLSGTSARVPSPAEAGMPPAPPTPPAPVGTPTTYLPSVSAAGPAPAAPTTAGAPTNALPPTNAAPGPYTAPPAYGAPAPGAYQVPPGYGTPATGAYQVPSGYGTPAPGAYQVPPGYGTPATGAYQVPPGYGTPATGSYMTPTPAPGSYTPPAYCSPRLRRGTPNLVPLALVGLALLALTGGLHFVWAAAIPLALGLIFLYVSSQGPGKWGFRIPGTILTGLGAGIVLDAMSYNSDGGYSVVGLGLGFIALWVRERSQWWWLIPGAVIGLGGLQAVWGAGGWRGGFLVPLLLILFVAYLANQRTARSRQ